MILGFLLGSLLTYIYIKFTYRLVSKKSLSTNSGVFVVGKDVKFLRITAKGGGGGGNGGIAIDGEDGN